MLQEDMMAVVQLFSYTFSTVNLVTMSCTDSAISLESATCRLPLKTVVQNVNFFFFLISSKKTYCQPHYLASNLCHSALNLCFMDQ